MRIFKCLPIIILSNFLYAQTIICCNKLCLWTYAKVLKDISSLDGVGRGGHVVVEAALLQYELAWESKGEKKGNRNFNDFTVEVSNFYL